MVRSWQPDDRQLGTIRNALSGQVQIAYREVIFRLSHVCTADGAKHLGFYFRLIGQLSFHAAGCVFEHIGDGGVVSVVIAFTLVTDKYPATVNIRGTIEVSTPAGAKIGALGIRIPVAHTFTTLPALAK